MGIGCYATMWIRGFPRLRPTDGGWCSRTSPRCRGRLRGRPLDAESADRDATEHPRGAPWGQERHVDAGWPADRLPRAGAGSRRRPCAGGRAAHRPPRWHGQRSAWRRCLRRCSQGVGCRGAPRTADQSSSTAARRRTAELRRASPSSISRRCRRHSSGSGCVRITELAPHIIIATSSSVASPRIRPCAFARAISVSSEPARPVSSTMALGSVKAITSHSARSAALRSAERQIRSLNASQASSRPSASRA